MMNNGLNVGGYGGPNMMLSQQQQQQQRQQHMSLAQRGQPGMGLSGFGQPQEHFMSPGGPGAMSRPAHPGAPFGGQQGMGGMPLAGYGAALHRGDIMQTSGSGSHGSIGFGRSGSGTDDNFVIEKEDFPALPGTASKPSAGSSNEQQQQQQHSTQQQQQNQQQQGIPPGGQATSAASQMNQGLPMNSNIFAGASKDGSSGTAAGGSAGSGSESGPNDSAAGSIASVVAAVTAPVGAVVGKSVGAQSAAPGAKFSAVSAEAKYGLGGLLDIIRLTDKDLSSLTLGTDLTTFGLNLNSSDSLFSTFSSPFSDKPLSPEPQFRTPACYMMNPPSLKSDHLSKFQLETLFYMFFSMPKDILQACAAQELYRRDWRYHGELKVWLKARTQQELMQSHPSVQFLFFDSTAWETRLYTAPKGNVAAGLLSEEDVRVKAPQPSPPQAQQQTAQQSAPATS